MSLLKKLTHSLIVLSLLASSTVVSAADFEDVPEYFTYADAIEYLHKYNVINGYEDGTFRPENDINHAEFLKVLVHSKVGEPDNSSYNNCFYDVADQWYASYVCYGKKNGYVKGYGNGFFKPEQTVSMSEAVKMIIEVNEVEVAEAGEGEEWYSPYVSKMYDLGVPGPGSGDFFPDEVMSRGVVSDLLHRFLTVGGLAPEKQRYIDAVLEASCMVLEAEDLADAQLEEDTRAIFADYGFPVEDEDEMEFITDKYSDDEDVNNAIVAGVSSCGDTDSVDDGEMTGEEIDAAHNGLVASLDDLLVKEEIFWDAYMALEDGDTDEDLQGEYDDFAASFLALDTYYSETVFDDSQQSFLDEYYDNYKPFMLVYLDAAGDFVDMLSNQAFDLDEMIEDVEALDALATSMPDAHNVLIDLVNEQADEVSEM